MGNVVVKYRADVPIFALVVWGSLVPPLPALMMSSVVDQRPFFEAVFRASWSSIDAAVFHGLVNAGYALGRRLAAGPF